MSDVSQEQFRSEALEADDYTCQYCGHRNESGRGLEAHHIRLKSRGGEDSGANSAVLCKPHHDAVHALGEGDHRPVSVLESHDVPKEIPDIRGVNTYSTVMCLDVLTEGRVTPRYLKEQTDLNNQQVNYALNQLIAAGWVNKVTTGLYELIADPREENKDERDNN